MKIGLLTVPFNNNYGGFLQAFALKTYLESKGHSVTIINRRRDWEKLTLKQKIKCQIKKIVYKSVDISIHTNHFIKTYLLPITKEIYSSSQLKKLRNYDFYIVGSDQVWRYNYAPSNISDYFFEFLDGINKPRISYAASFGTSYNEYDGNTIKKCAQLLKQFKALSVREQSGIKLLSNIFSVSTPVSFVLDPTMLLEKNIYEKLAEKYPIEDNKYIFTYILDKTDDKKELANRISSSKNLPILNIDAQTSDNVSTIIEPIEKWLSAIINSSFVITDSFHGMVFSIIFNKPFTVYINRNRGAERFESLLSLLNIKDVLIDDSRQYKELEFNWNQINNVIEKEKYKSKQFLDIFIK